MMSAASPSKSFFAKSAAFSFFASMLFFVAFAPHAHAALIGHWTLDAGDINWGTGAVTDSSGHGNTGTVHNLDASDETTGQVGGGLQFNGTNSYISVPVNGTFPVSGNNPRTVCLWFKPTSDSWTPDVNSIFEYGNAGDSFGIDMDSFPNIQFYTWHNDLFVAMGIAGHETDWLQICWVWNGTSSSLLYSNGVLRGSQNFGSSINTSQTEVSIGRSALTSGYFPGIIDEVRMYDTAFTGDEINSLYVEATNPAAISNVASTTGETTATVTWDTAATSSDSTLWYGTASGTYTAKSSSASLVTNHSLGLSGLTPLTTYYFVVVSKDVAGDIATSSEATMTTVDLTAPAISSLATSSVTSSGVTVAWTTNEAASTRVAYGLTSTYSTYASETDTSPRVTSHSKNISSLLACTSYHYAAVSRDAAGNTATSSDATFTTTGCDYSATPTSSSSGTVGSGMTATTTIADSGKDFSVGFTATSTSLVIQIKAVPSDPVIDSYGAPAASPNTVGITVFDVKAIVNGSTVLDSFDVPVTITYQYTDGEISGLDESSLKLYHYHGGAWVALDSCSVNQSSNTISCTTSSFSIFGLFGSSLPASNSSSSSGGSSLPWCSGPTAPGWNSSLPNGGCGTKSAATPVSVSVCPAYPFARTLRFGMTGEDVRALQKLMNCLGFTLAASGPGSSGKETNLFVDKTYAAVIKFQEAYAADILAPVSAAKGTGIFATYSQKKAAELIK